MSWGEWLGHDASEALSLWKQAAKEISQRFDLAKGCKVQKASAKQNERAFWLLIHEPLEGIRLLTVRMPSQGNLNGQIKLKIWSYAERKAVWSRFEHEPTFTFRGGAFKPYPCTPQDSWKIKLDREGVDVYGKAFSGKLADMGGPAEAVTVLRTLFESFSDFVLEHHQKVFFEPRLYGEFSPSDNSSTHSSPISPLIPTDTHELLDEQKKR
ncbi:hypothetical protein [Delftia lacustris]|uniref:hypothetical protein n=1 Tax=Delftia lacustris TaxID=558537 RepID=UPI0035A6D721